MAQDSIADTHHQVRFASAHQESAMPASSANLILTSPPYPMIAMWDEVFAAQNPSITPDLIANRPTAAFAAMHEVLDSVWGRCWEALVPGGFLIINIGDATRSAGGSFRLYTNQARIVTAAEALGLETLPSIIWRKTTNAPTKFMGSGMLPSGAYVTLEHESILIFRKPGKIQPIHRQNRRHSALFWEERNAWYSDLWDLGGTRQALDSAARQRSAAFPFEIAYRLILMYSQQGDTVLDPFLGTGTTSLAALAAGRQSWGVDIDSSLSPVIIERLEIMRPSIDRRNRQRLADHRAFVQTRQSQGKPLAHYNLHYDFPVVTSQETDLLVPLVESVSIPVSTTTGLTWTVRYTA